MSSPSDSWFMQQALEEARQGWGTTHPNPMVGAVVVEDGEIVARGYHAIAGGPHAEVQAIRNLGREPRAGASLYVTLEPCSTVGRTPACTDAIQRAGFQRVVVGAVDPNPLHAGGGLDILRDAGIEVVSGVEAEACEDLNLIFNHWVTHGGKPLVAGKLALTLDGKIAASNGHSRWVTGPEARQDVMHWRRLFPAIGVGADTVLFDDPELTSRDESGKPIWVPRRFIFDPSFRTVTPELPKVYSDAYAEQTTLVSSDLPDPSIAERLSSAGVEVWALGESSGTPQFFEAFSGKLAEAGLVGIYLEGGGKLISRFVNAGALHYLFTYKAPKILGDANARPGFEGRQPRSMEQAIRLEQVQFSILGKDVLTRGFLHLPEEEDDSAAGS